MEEDALPANYPQAISPTDAARAARSGEGRRSAASVDPALAAIKKAVLTPDGTIIAVTQFSAVDLFVLEVGLRRKRMGVGGSARSGHNGGPQGPLCHWLMAAETSPGCQVG